MPTLEDIIEQATKLGELIAEHETVKKLASANQAFEDDINSQRVFTDYQRFAQALQQKMQMGQPVEVADKQQMETLKQAVITNPLLANMQKAEMDYLDLLRKVDRAIISAGGEVMEPTPGPGPAPAGGPVMG